MKKLMLSLLDRRRFKLVLVLATSLMYPLVLVTIVMVQISTVVRGGATVFGIAGSALVGMVFGILIGMLFPIGLFFWFHFTGWVNFLLLPLGWILYIALSFSIVLSRRRLVTWTFYALLVILLLLNIAGCRAGVGTLRGIG